MQLCKIFAWINSSYPFCMVYPLLQGVILKSFISQFDFYFQPLLHPCPSINYSVFTVWWKFSRFLYSSCFSWTSFPTIFLSKLNNTPSSKQGYLLESVSTFSVFVSSPLPGCNPGYNNTLSVSLILRSLYIGPINNSKFLWMILPLPSPSTEGYWKLSYHHVVLLQFYILPGSCILCLPLYAVQLRRIKSPFCKHVYLTLWS